MQGPLSLKNKMLSTPLLNMPKNSTPIRTRFISNTGPLNSTPINQLKYASTETSYSNKQNKNTTNTSNYNSSQVSKDKVLNERTQNNSLTDNKTMFAKTVCFGDYNAKRTSVQESSQFASLRRQHFSNGAANLSPIMALNRKLNEGPTSTFKNDTFRSFTPNNGKRDNSPLQQSREKEDNENCIKSTSMILEQKQKTFGQNSGLRSSSSFSNLFQKRSKTPTRLGSMAFSSLSRKGNPSPSGLKQSLSFQTNFLTQSKKTLIQKSPTINLNQSNYENSLIQNRIPCYNHQNKIAKYRIIDHENNHQEMDGSMMFCSKCAIDLVQKGMSVEEINYSQMPSLHTSPREQKFSQLRQSNSFHNKFLNFKTSYNSQILQKLKFCESTKTRLTDHINTISANKSKIQQKFESQIQEIDCYYNSLIAYIDEQRKKDKAIIESLKSKIIHEYLDQNEEGFEQRIIGYMNKVQSLLKSRNFNNSSIKQLEDIDNYLNYFDKSIGQNNDFSLFDNPNTRMFYFQGSIQEQFDDFVSYFDNDGKLKFKSFEQASSQNFQKQKMVLEKNHGLRFSFQKALQNQNKKKNLIQTGMNPLQQESEQEYEENSFNQDNHMMSDQYQNQSSQNVEQKPFRTLFAEDDDILQQSEIQEDKVKTAMYSPTFKAI